MALGKPLNCLSFYLLVRSAGQSHVPTDGVGSVPSTQPGRSGRTSPHSQMLTASPVCHAAGQPEGDSEGLGALGQSEAGSPLWPACAGAGGPASTPTVGTVVFS